MAFAPAGPDRAFARVEMSCAAEGIGGMVEARSGISRIPPTAPGRQRFSRLHARPVYNAARYQKPPAEHVDGYRMELHKLRSRIPRWCSVVKSVRSIVHDVFAGFESGYSIQEVIYEIGCRVLEQIPAIAEIDLEANNRTWDTIVEQGELMGVYTDSRPPYGCLGLSLRR